MLKFKIIDYFDKHNLATLDEKQYHVVLLANTYEQEFKVIHNTIMEFDNSEKLKLIDINDYILNCHNAYNGVSELNFHHANTNRSWI